MTVQISLQVPFAYIVFYCEKPPPTSVYHFTYSYTISEPDILIHHDSSFLSNTYMEMKWYPHVQLISLQVGTSLAQFKTSILDRHNVMPVS